MALNLYLDDCSNSDLLADLARLDYQDNDPSRDMSDAEIVKALSNLEQAAQSGGDPIHGQFHRLNDWRY